MKWKCSANELVLIFIIIVIFVFKIINNGFDKINSNTPPTIINDTIYNYVRLDSIEYNIKVKDSIIYNIRYEYETEYIKAENLDDSSAVELFKRLCTDDSLYGRDSIY